MAGADPFEDDEFPPRRPFGVPAGPVSAEPDDDDDSATPRGERPAGSTRSQPPATPS